MAEDQVQAFASQEAALALQSIPGLQVQSHVPLSDLTFIRAGGPADLLVRPQTIDALIALKQLSKREGWPLTILGRASNVLVSDQGIRGITVLLSPSLAHVRVEGESLICQAGASLYRIAARAAREGLTGFEFACGIPGSVGGAVFMNAGAFDGSLSDCVVRTAYLDSQGQRAEITGSQHDFAYRHSFFSQNPDTIILETELSLTRTPAQAIYDKMADLAHRRYSVQPLDAHSAGSAFRRPPGHYAGKLISDAGMKGYVRGRAGVSAKHAGFIINLGGATAAEIARIFTDVRQAVFDQAGVLLVPEVRLLGEWEGDPFAIQ